MVGLSADSETLDVICMCYVLLCFLHFFIVAFSVHPFCIHCILSTRYSVLKY